MADDVGSLVVRIEAQMQNFEAGLNSATEKMNGFHSTMLGVAKAIAGAFIIHEVADFFKSTVEEAGKSQETLMQLSAVLKSTGGQAGVTAESATGLAESLSGVTKFSKDTVLGAENMLLTFTNIGKDVFPQATTAVLNMSTALGQDLKSSSIQLGKALQDPVAGATALQRVGVKLTEAQKEQIKAFVASGNTMAAQKVILKELDTEFGNSAVMAGQTFPGKLAILSNKFDELKISIGNKLIPVLADMVDWFSAKLPTAQEFVSNAFDKIKGAIGFVTDNANVLIPVLGGIATAFLAQGIINTVADFMEAYRLATETATAAQWLLNLAMDANPIGIIALAIAGLVTALVLLYNNNETVRKGLTTAWTSIKETASIVFDALGKYVNYLVGVFDFAWPYIKEIVRVSVNELVVIISGLLIYFHGITEFINGIFKGDWNRAWNGIKEIFRGIWQTIVAIISPASIQLAFNLVKIAIIAKLGEWKTAIISWFDTTKTNIVTKFGEWKSEVENWFKSIPKNITDKLTEWKTALILWFNNTKIDIITKFDEWWISIGKWFESIPKKITDQLVEWKNALVKWSEEQNKENIRQFGEWWNDIKTWFESIPKKITDQLVEWETVITKWFDDTRKTIVKKFGDWETDIKKWYEDTKKEIVTKLNAWWTSMNQWYDDTKTNILKKHDDWWNGIKKWYQDTLKNILAELDDWWKGIGPKFTDMGKKSIENLEKGNNDKKQEFTDNLGQLMVDGIKGAAKVAFIAIIAAGEESIKTYIKTVKAMDTDVKDAFVYVWSKGITYIEGLATEALTWGKNIVEGLWNGVNGAAGWLQQKMQSFANSILAAMRSALGVQSPSKKAMEIGEYIGQGLAIGIGNQAGNVSSAMKKLTSGTGGGINLGAVTGSLNLSSGTQSTSNKQSSAMVGQKNNYAGMISGNTFIVRNDNDIHAIAREIFNLSKQKARGSGVVYPS